jgi:hypothetical protein
MLVNALSIQNEIATKQATIKETSSLAPVLQTDSGEVVFIDTTEQTLSKSIGQLIQGKTLHYYSNGSFNLVRLLLYIIKQTGPVHVFMTSYSISQTSIEQLKNKIDKGDILSYRVIVDNRVRSLSPKPFQMLATSFDYRCSAIHSKVALLWNDSWKISIVTSQNATDNPKLERGTIFTSEDVFQFDFKNLTNEFNRGTT